MVAKLRMLFWLGIVTIFLPYLGITSGIRTALTIAIGAFVIWLSLRLRRHFKELRYRLRKLEEPPHTPELHTHE